ncbi:MAG: aminomethyltransferase family protein [Thermodesulfobacteriota bacterium]|nr:aminomethyltransferase family protein [Thermodesulfobacteriota bacterium]
MEKEVKMTLLHEWHVNRGANMAQFGEYDMPLWYPTGVRSEHLSVLTNAGIFDTSHMAVVMIDGSDARDLLQHCFSNNLDACIGKQQNPLIPGKCVYGVFLRDTGDVIDDAIVFQIDESIYMVVVNAGMGNAISTHLLDHAGRSNVDITDLTDKLGKLDVQGPFAAKILIKVLKSPQTVFDKLPYFSFKGHFDPSSTAAKTVLLSDGTPILLSRTGYTGEFGFEIFVEPDHFTRTWDILVEAGNEFGLVACGLAARDSLRAGAVLPLSHQDIGPWPFLYNPWPFALAYNADFSGFTKQFIGSESLLKTDYSEHTLPFAGYDLRKVSTHNQAIVTDDNDKQIGKVLTCATDMAIGRHNDRIYSIASPDKPKNFNPRGLCCGFVKTAVRLSPGQTVTINDNRRKIKVEIANDLRPNRTARLALSKFLN